MTPPTGILGAGISVDNHGSGAVGCTVVHKSNSPDSCDRDGLVFRTPYEKALQASCPTDLDLSPILQSKSFHIIGTPSTFIQCLDAIIDLRHEHRIVSSLPPIIWQPAPSGCHNTEIIQHMQNCRHIDVFSPTSIELWSLVEFEPSEEEMHLFSRKKIEQMAEVFVSPGIGKTGGHGVMVIRCGEHGNAVYSRAMLNSGSGPEWFPAFHSRCSCHSGGTRPSTLMLDYTGADDAFLGGFGMGLAETGDVMEAAAWGTVAASFAAEQIDTETASAGAGWDKMLVEARLDEYKAGHAWFQLRGFWEPGQWEWT